MGNTDLVLKCGEFQSEVYVVPQGSDFHVSVVINLKVTVGDKEMIVKSNWKLEEPLVLCNVSTASQNKNLILQYLDSNQTGLLLSFYGSKVFFLISV